MNIQIKRVYEPVSKSDGARILVDRLWPRGISKARAHITDWPKDAAPSPELRSWFHQDPEKRWSEFKKRYQAELKGKREEVRQFFEPHTGTITFVTAVKDIEHSHIPILKSYIEKLRKS